MAVDAAAVGQAHAVGVHRRDAGVGQPFDAQLRGGLDDRRADAFAQGGGPIEAAVKSAYEQFRGLNEGKNADYIPALAKVPSNYFGIALATPQGKLYTAGDIEPTFSIQSISKVFTLALVLQESGEQLVEDDIGVDATGQVFNSIIAVEQHRGKEMNSFVNPGAIATERLVTMMKKRAQDRLGDAERWEELTAPLPFGRAGKPEEIGWMVAFLASDKSAYTTGTIVTIDGGVANRGPMF